MTLDVIFYPEYETDIPIGPDDTRIEISSRDAVPSAPRVLRLTAKFIVWRIRPKLHTWSKARKIGSDLAG